MKKFYFLLLGLCLFSGMNAQIVTIPDANFKAKLLASSSSNTIAANLVGTHFKIDSNSDNEIQVSEALQVGYLNISTSNIGSLIGIQDFTKLQRLDCSTNQLQSINVNGLTYLQQLFCNNNLLPNLNISGLINLRQLICNNNLLPSLNVSGLTTLQLLNCSYNQLPNLNVSGLINLNTLRCDGNQLPSLNVSGLINLHFLYCGGNQLPSLNVSGLTNLQELYCNNNLLPDINVSGLLNLEELDCSNNQLPSLNVNGLSSLQRLMCNNNFLPNLNLSGLTSLQFLNCRNNQLTSLSINNLTNLSQLYCHNNLLTSLFIKNGNNENILNFSNNPNLQYICADEGQIGAVQTQINTYGYTNCHVNSYCSFTPGGIVYNIQGNNKFDFDNNGCDVTDLNYPNLKLTFSDGINTGNLISSTSGSYHYDVQAGTQTITPVLENPTYFNVSPTTSTVTFPTQTSPFNQDFCVTANGIHSDLEVTILPTLGARPGFDAKYKIIYKNKGTNTQSGSVNLTFNDAVLDLVSANPATSSQATNNLSWNFINLLPFENREITLTLNVNSPTETPAVNSGYILNYNATITSAATDDTTNDNVLIYNQTVVNSFDPNDKTCIEGTTISPAKVGDYVHYMIRFENNGTAIAQNIVVKDMIDTAKFDINTLIPIKGSHSFITNITSGNKVEFIFQNINLPFDNANNDGYVAFKIKTKTTLVIGDTFTNNASIYFDYNFPIVTNTATTTIAVLATQDFVFSNYFSVYPNPVKDMLNITAKETIEVTSINIYNTLGQLVLVIPNAQNTSSVDVSSLTKGNYFIKINSDKGTSNTKFIKN